MDRWRHCGPGRQQGHGGVGHRRVLRYKLCTHAPSVALLATCLRCRCEAGAVAGGVSLMPIDHGAPCGRAGLHGGGCAGMRAGERAREHLENYSSEVNHDATKLWSGRGTLQPHVNHAVRGCIARMVGDKVVAGPAVNDLRHAPLVQANDTRHVQVMARGSGRHERCNTRTSPSEWRASGLGLEDQAGVQDEMQRVAKTSSVTA